MVLEQRLGGWTSGGAAIVVAAVVGLVVTATALRGGALILVVLLPVLLVFAVLAVVKPLWAVALLLVVLPLGLTESLVPAGPVDIIYLIAGFVVAVVVLHRLLAGRAPLAWHPSAGWAVGLLVLVVVAAVTAQDVGAAIPFTATLVVAMALGFAVHAACPGWAELRLLVTLLAAVGTGVCLYSLGGAGDIQAGLSGAGEVQNRALGVFQSPNQLGTFSGMLLLIGLGLAMGARTRWERVVGTACLLSATAALLVSLSRAAWIGTVIALVAMVVLSVRARRFLPAVLVAGAVVVPAALAASAPQLWEVLSARAAALVEVDANPQDARPLIYREALRQIVADPWTGLGPGNYPLGLDSAGSAAPTVDVGHAHNVLLQAAAEAGIPAALVLVAFTLSVARSVLRARSRLPAREVDLLGGLAAGLVVVLGQGLADFTLTNPTLLFLAWLVVGFLFCATTRTPDVEGADHHRPWRHGAAVAGLRGFRRTTADEISPVASTSGSSPAGHDAGCGPRKAAPPASSSTAGTSAG